MKNYIKAVVTFVFLVVAVTVTPNVSSAASEVNDVTDVIATQLAAPTGVRQIGATKNSVKIEWGAVPGADEYYWSWSLDGISGWSDGQYDWCMRPTDTIYQLSAGSTYYVRVRAADTSDWDNYKYGEWSQPIEVVTAPDAAQMGTLTLTEATTSSLTITWTPCPGATSYQIFDNATKAALGTVTDCKFVRNGLAPENSYDTTVVPVRTSTTGYAAFDSSRTLSSAYTRPNKPVTPSTANFGLTNIYYNINVAYFGATDPSRPANGYEIEVYTLAGNKKVFTASGGNNRFVVKRNTAYKYRCRFFTTYGNERIYGDWSPNRYFVYQTASGKKYPNRIKMSWKKVSGAKSYTVSISTKEKGGYKKVKTLSSKSTSLTIRKCGKSKIKKGKTYYVKVVANLKDGGRTVKSDVNYIGKSN